LSDSYHAPEHFAGVHIQTLDFIHDNLIVVELIKRETSCAHLEESLKTVITGNGNVCLLFLIGLLFRKMSVNIEFKKRLTGSFKQGRLNFKNKKL
jgi:uncharacterized radical SAM superfamily protein